MHELGKSSCQCLRNGCGPGKDDDSRGGQRIGTDVTDVVFRERRPALRAKDFSDVRFESRGAGAITNS
jgi:hypothetical protein